MKVLDISSSQFAGVLNKKYPPEGTFSDGVNIIYGPNESGKTTMVNLLSKILFQAVSIDKRSHKDFIQQYFPSEQKSGLTGDFVDGAISFQGKDGVYHLSKEWGKRSSCILELPGGSRIADPTKISEILEAELSYSEGLFDAVIFPSQKDSDRAIQVLLNAAQKGKDSSISDARQEILTVIQQAFVESGGVSIEELGAKIDEKIASLEGKYWDSVQAAPKRNPKGGRWQRDKGKILAAFYESEDAENRRCQIEALEKEIDQVRCDIEEIDGKIADAQESQRRFDKFRTQLTARNQNLEHKAMIERDLERMNRALKEWPQFQADALQAERLAAELNSSAALEQWKRISAIKADIDALQLKISSNGEVSKEEKRTAEGLARDIDRLARQLSGMNLFAHINLLNGHELQVVSVSTGLPVLMEDDVFHLTEAVRLTIPGIIEMDLSPADIDLASTEQSLQNSQQALDRILQQHNVEDVAQLNTQFEQCEELRRNKERLETQLEQLLAGSTLEEIQSDVSLVPSDTRPQTDIQTDIRALCGNMSANDFASRKKALADNYAKDFTSLETLRQKISDAELKRQELITLLDSGEQIPPEYQGIQDPDAYSNKMLESIKALQSDRLTQGGNLGRMEERLDGLNPNEVDTIRDCEEKQRNLKALQSELAHWKHIQSVFTQLKESLLNNPAGDLAAQFEHYLNCISNGKVSTNMLSTDALNLALYSGDHRLTFETLSEGTKDTVALAFRLAVLEYLYPDGGGLAVFDDPFTDMDADRKTEACNLLKEFSKRHQVIFLTCSEEYATLLGGTQFNLQ